MQQTGRPLAWPFSAPSTCPSHRTASLSASPPPAASSSPSACCPRWAAGSSPDSPAPPAAATERCLRPHLQRSMGFVRSLGGRSADNGIRVVEKAVAIIGFSGFLVVQQAARRIVPRGHGSILLTGATASVKGFARSPAFAMGKFALRSASPDPRESTLRISSSTARWAPSKSTRQPGQHARSRCNCPDLCRRAASASERLVARCRGRACGSSDSGRDRRPTSQMLRGCSVRLNHNCGRFSYLSGY
jgi:hypothetical protein